MEKEADYLFEVSWEVCNKVGGIFTVITSKAAQVKKYYGQNYFLIGPYFPPKAYGIFEEKLAPEGMKQIFEKLKKEGVHCHFWTWLVKGEPNVILIEFSGCVERKNDIKKELWDAYKIDSMNTEYFDYDEPVVWGCAVARLLQEIASLYKGKKIVAQFHEWLSGSGLLLLKHWKVPVATVFTTHATMLGRTLASANINPYELFGKIDPEQEARNRGITAKHQTEKQCAVNANVFTTVSEITGMEAENLLGRKPDVILPNGLDMEKFPTFEQASIKHKIFKARIKDFILYYFFPYYSFDLDHTLIYFLCGRYEFHDKGIDIFIKALGILNEKLKKSKIERNVVAFFWVPGNIKGIRPELLESKTFYEDIKDGIEDDIDDIKHRLVHSLISSKKLVKEELFDEDFLEELRRKLLRFGRKGAPPLSTHHLYDEDKDIILNTLKQVGLNNEKNDPVKVVYYPIYLTGADGLLDTSYYESMHGSHMGVFPSFYEPWGYTPLEGGALGVPSITTDLSGFGRYVYKECSQQKNPGIWVLPRLGKSDDEVVQRLADVLYYYSQLTPRERVENKMNARKVAETADWKFFIENYIQAHNLAVKKMF
jgi:glycogen(starch) synthase